MYQDDEFERFCRERYEQLCKALDLLGYEINEPYESYKVSNYEYLERIYINSIEDKTIH